MISGLWSKLLLRRVHLPLCEYYFYASPSNVINNETSIKFRKNNNNNNNNNNIHKIHQLKT